MVENIGFNREERSNPEITIEDILKQIVAEEKDPYAICRGEFLQITGQGFETMGVYQGIRNFGGFSEMVLYPTLLQKSVDAPTRETPNRKISYFDLSNKPSFANLHGVVLITPYDKDYILSRVEGTQKIAGIKRILVV